MQSKGMMKAAFINEFGGIDRIKLGQMPIPQPKENEVQIAVEYAGINPVDWKICEGLIRNQMRYEFPIILGWDVSGVVSEVGSEVKYFKQGDPVFAYCRKNVIHDGSYAEYICLDANNVVLKPDNTSFAQAAAIPLSSLTAWQSLFDSAHLRPNENILIHAGAGGVGGFAIQFAKYTGAHVITTASATNHSYVKSLGADTIIDYTKENFEDKVLNVDPQGVDVVFDTVGGTTLKSSYKVAKQGGRLISIVELVDKTHAAQRKLFSDFVFVSPNGKELKRIATLIEEGTIKTPNITEIPFDDLATGLRKSREGHLQGKMVVKIKT